MTTAQRSIFVDTALKGLTPTTQAIVAADAFRQCEEASLQAYWQALGPGGEALSGYAKAVPYPGAAPEDYAHQLLDLGGGLQVLGGLHVYGMDPARPFVNIRGTSRPMTPRDLDRAFRALAALYPRQGPKALRHWSGAVSEEPLDSVVDQHLLVGHLGELPDWAHVPGLRLEADPECQAYPGLRSAFEAFALQAKGERPFLRFATLEACQEAAVTGCARVAYLDGALLGFIAATLGEEQGLRGWVMLEAFILPAFQGRGLGRAMQRSFLQELKAASDISLILGTIDGRNAPSIKTALSCGRHIAGSWRFSPGPP